MDSEETSGARIKARRQRLGLKATTLADLAEVSRPHLSEVENGHREPKVEWVRQVERALDQYERETGQDEPEVAPVVAEAPAPLRITFHDVYGIGEIIVEGPADHPEELSEAIAKLLADLRKRD